jgi:hypothetical protein
LIFGAASGDGSAALEDGPDSSSELRDFGKRTGDGEYKSTLRNERGVAHGVSDGLVTPFDLNLLAFVRQFLLHGAGPGRGPPRLTRKGVGMAIERRRLCGPILRVAIEQAAWASRRRCTYAMDKGKGGRGGRGRSGRGGWRVGRGGKVRLGRMTLGRKRV